MKKSIVLPLLLLMSSLAFAQSVTVNGKTISAAKINEVVKANVSQGIPDSPRLRQEVKENLITREVLLQEAEKKKLNALSSYRTQVENASQTILLQELKRDFLMKNRVSDLEVQQVYSTLKQTSGDKEYEVFHILVRTEAEAKAIISELGDGGFFGADVETFQKIAKEKSLDQNTKANGGKLGWRTPNTFSAGIAKVVRELEKGSFTKKPAQSALGFHIVMVNDIRDYQLPPLAQMKKELAIRIQEVKWANYVQSLRKKAVVK